MRAPAAVAALNVPQHGDHTVGGVETTTPSATAVLSCVAVMVIATVAGAMYASRGREQRVWLGISAGALLVIGMFHLLPDALDSAREQGLAMWAIVVTMATAFLAAWCAGRAGCACGSDPARLNGTTSAAALAVHRVLEGAALAFGGVAVAVGLAVHAAGEGVAVGALLRGRLVVWVTGMCVAPAVGVALAVAAPALGAAEPLMLAVAAGVLLEAARTSLDAAVRRPDGMLVILTKPSGAAAVSALVTLVAVQAVG
jgi:zinc transporter ZupT